jgi:phosphoglycerol transferase
MATLGTTGDVGFIFLLGWLLCARKERRDDQLLTALAVLSVSAVLLGTLGGFGTIFNYLVFAEFRSYNRISIYIAFFSLFAIALLLDALRRWMKDDSYATWLWRGVLGVVLCLGILDQTNSSFAPDYASRKRDYQEEQDFVDQIETSVPSGAMIFQLPNVHFPEGKLIPGLHQYDELKGYLHSHSLRWSSGAMRGRPAALWEAHHGLDIGEQEAETGPDGVRTLHIQILPPEALNTLVVAGFKGIYIDRNGFLDRGAAITSQLRTLLAEQPLRSKNHRLEFFNLTSFTAALRAKYTAEQWEAERRTALALPSP